jgi:hypothetical protein
MTAETQANDPQVEEQRYAREIETLAANDSPDPADQAAPPRSGSDGAAPERATPERGEGAEGDAAPLRRVTPADEQRNRLADRFKQRRAAAGGQLDFHGDHRDPTQVYGQLAVPPEPAATPPLSDAAHGREPGVPEWEDGAQTPAFARAGSEDQPDPSSVPPSSDKLYRAKVNGVDVLLTEDQVLAEAQKSLAASDLLAQSKVVYRGAKREASGAPNQGDDPASGGSEPQPDPLPNQEPSIVDLIAELQSGDPEAAGAKLEQTIESRAQRAAGNAAREAVLRERIERELATARRVFGTFEAANADLARDEFAREAIERQVYREYGEDLKALGIPVNHIPQDPVTRASWHNQLRATGAPVRDVGTILTAARDRFVAWRGGGPNGQPKPQPQAARTAPPRIEVSVNRDDRRAVLPTQPTRASVPPKAASAAPPQRSRSDVIAGMRKSRGQIVA